MSERLSADQLDLLLDAVRCIPSRGDTRLCYRTGGGGSQYTTYLLESGEIADIYLTGGSDGSNTSMVILGRSLKHFNYSDEILEHIFRAIGPDVNPTNYEERLKQWQIARGFVPAPIGTNLDRFEIPSYLTINPDYTTRFNEILRDAPSLLDKVYEVSSGSRKRIGRFTEGGEAFDGYKGLPELVSTALFVDGQDIYVLRKPQVIPGSSGFILADYEWKKKLEIRQMSEGPSYVNGLHRFGYPLPFSDSPRDKRDFTVVYDPENEGFPCIYGGGGWYGSYEEAQKAARKLGLSERFLSPVFPFPEMILRNNGLVFLGVGGKYPLGIHVAKIHPPLM